MPAQMQLSDATSQKRVHKFGEFDLLKAIAILGLPAVHLIEEGVYHDFLSDGVLSLESVIVALCMMGPSVFMICMGFTMGGARSSPKIFLNMGVRFLMLGALLNLVRWFIPAMILWAVRGDSPLKEIGFCLASDIYFFVGFFCIFYALIRKLKINSTGLIVCSIVMLSLNTLLTPLTAKLDPGVIVDCLLGNIVYMSDTSCFPLLSWAIFPSVGIVLGDVLKKMDDERRGKFMTRLMVFSPMIFASFIIFLWSYDFDILKVMVSPLNDYITDLPNVILMITLALFLFGALYYPCKLLDKTRFMNFMVRISTYIVPFYLLQWVLVAWVFFCMDIFSMSSGALSIEWYLLCVVVVTGLCIYVSIRHGVKANKFIARITSFRRRKRKTRKNKS